MHIIYVDESGDPGKYGYGSPHYILSGLIVSQNFWQEHLSRLKTFRRYVKENYGLNQRTEIHASELIRINKIKEYPKGSLRKYGVNLFFNRLEPILLKEASNQDDLGIVRN